MNKTITDFTIAQNIRLNHDTFLLLLKHPEVMPPILAGQFVQVLVEDAPHTFLRRPISVHDVDYENNILTLFVKIVGKGTQKLSELSAGNTLNLIYPLGNSFTILNNQKVLLAGGGCGIAPLLYLAKVLLNENCDVHFLLGAKSSKDILLLETFNKYGHIHVCTDDGSMGIKGLLIQHPVIKNDLKTFSMVYTCGPERMMQAVAKMAKAAEVSCEVSLENTMACGIGACLCCVVKTNEGHKCVCTEGPVFNSNNLSWPI